MNFHAFNLASIRHVPSHSQILYNQTQQMECRINDKVQAVRESESESERWENIWQNEISINKLKEHYSN